MMANRLSRLLRFVAPQQRVASYMESKIPVPTDNIYKFYALFSLFVFIFSIGAVLYVNQDNNDRILRFYPELEALKQSKELTPHDEVRKGLLERLLEVQRSDQKVYKSGLGLLGGFAFWGMIFGFWRWHREVQPRIDEANRVQLDILKLNLIKLQLEVEELKGKGVDTP